MQSPSIRLQIQVQIFLKPPDSKLHENEQKLKGLRK